MDRAQKREKKEEPRSFAFLELNLNTLNFRPGVEEEGKKNTTVDVCTGIPFPSHD